MKKLIATIFLGVLAFGSMSGCVVDDGHRGDGRPGDHMDHHPGPGDREEHRDDRKDEHRDEHRGHDQRDDDHH